MTQVETGRTRKNSTTNRECECCADGRGLKSLVRPAGIESATCGLGIVSTPTSDNRTPEETTKEYAPVQGHVGENIGLPLAVPDAGTSSCMTSQCSTILPSFTLKISTATSGFGPQPT